MDIDMLLSLPQIKAARALLSWNQEDLARHAGVKPDQIRGYEVGRTKPADVGEAILNAFTAAGLIFPNGGVQPASTIYTIEGEGWYLKLLGDVYFTLEGQRDGELLIEYADDSKSSAEVIQRVKKLRDIGVKMRLLVEEGNTYLMGPLQEYRYVPKERFSNYVSLIYGDKVAVCTNLKTQSKKAVIFNDPALAETRKNSFNLLWDVLKEPKKSNASIRY